MFSMYILGKLNELDKLSEFLNFFKDHKGIFIFILMAILIGFIIYFIFIMVKDDDKDNKVIDEAATDIKESHRDLPCKGDLFITYFVLSESGILDYLSVKGNLILSLYLSWIKKGILKVKNIDNQPTFYFDNTSESMINDNIEQKLYETVKNTLSTNSNGFKADELVKCLVNNNQIVVNFFKDAYEEGKARIIKIATSSTVASNDFNVTPYIQELKKQIVSFQNYLINFSRTNQEGFDSNYILDNYYIFSNLLGINKTIENSWFTEKVNPDMLKLVNSSVVNNLDEYAHTNNLYSDEEFNRHKNIIKKSEKAYNKIQKKEFLHV